MEAANAIKSLVVFASRAFDLVIADVAPSHEEGTDTITRIRDVTPGTPILVLGDPGQLPPVTGGGFFTNQEPDYLLTDMHRQARDNPIIQLAMQVREGNEIMYGD